MCSLGFARSFGFALIPLAICCVVANVLLFFPDGVVDFVRDGHLSMYVWSFMGIGGGGIAIFITAVTFWNMERYGSESCALCGSVLASLIGLVGSGYCFIISVLAMLEGPLCFNNFEWTTPFRNDGAKYLFAPESWSTCKQPAHIVEWNVTLLSILLGLSLIEFLICLVQFICGLVSAICRPCCYKQQYSLSA